MTQRDEALFTYWQTFRKFNGRTANDNEMDEFERKYRADLEVIRKCIERRE